MSEAKLRRVIDWLDSGMAELKMSQGPPAWWKIGNVMMLLNETRYEEETRKMCLRFFGGGI